MPQNRVIFHDFLRRFAAAPAAPEESFCVCEMVLLIEHFIILVGMEGRKEIGNENPATNVTVSDEFSDGKEEGGRLREANAMRARRALPSI